MEAVQSWVSEHKLTTIGALWAAGIGASLLGYSCTKSPMKPSLRLIHARMHSQALTLAVLSGAAGYHYYEKRCLQPKPVADNTPATDVTQIFMLNVLGAGDISVCLSYK
ncbi:unnamed protein product [Sphenostylis stenocarpa]|uniref:HIG1 domain-containing protein n=1 Tax=Sphenostylis stenocarpa TaxID=92480 RepID=A0AA86V6E5_9FABA|nr:unnamed protein product [Sphenostylis stenocarpa]